MKKIMFFLLLIIIPFSVQAYGIEEYNMELTILKNGDIDISESFNLNGEYNGFERIINYKNSSLKSFDGTLNSFYASDIYNGKGITLRGISGIKGGLKTPFNLSSDADLGDSNVYNITSTSSGEKYKIFNPAENEMAFALDYSINDIVVVHNDVAELYFNIFSD